MSPYLLLMHLSTNGMKVNIGERSRTANASYPEISSMFIGKNQIVGARLKITDHQM